MDEEYFGRWRGTGTSFVSFGHIIVDMEVRPVLSMIHRRAARSAWPIFIYDSCRKIRKVHGRADAAHP